MPDLEVEETLREIRERVLADARSRDSAQGVGARAAALEAGGATPEIEGAALDADHGSVPGEALARMQANLSTTERAWSRLPPLLSYRRGRAARLELWLKRLVKRAAHWFTWEQVNFNSAAHHALLDAREALAAHEQSLADLRNQLGALRSESRSNAQSNASRLDDLQARLDELQARLTDAESRFDSAFAALRRSLDEQAGQLRAAEWRAHTDARAGEIRKEVRDRVDALAEEQRVCFKQLSLEAAEAAVMHDRARRRIEARLDALEQAGEH
jgi:hypothetical protein